MRTQRILSILAAWLVAAVLSPPAAGQDFPYPKSLTWPPISVTTTIRNGWVVAQGRSLDGPQHMLWQTPVAPARGAVSLRQGYGSVMVSVGGRRFVLDNATGRAVELRPGEVLRQSPNVTASSSGEGAMGAGPTPPANEALNLPTLTDAQREAVKQLCQTNRQFMEKLVELDRIKRLYDAGKANADDIKAAHAAIADARQLFRQHEAKALQSISPKLGMDKEPAAPAVAPSRKDNPPTPAVAMAEENLMQLLTEYNKAETQLRTLDTTPNTPPQTIAEAQTQVNDLARQLREADVALQQVRLVGERPTLAMAGDDLRQQILAAEDRLAQATAAHDAAQQKLYDIQDEYERGKAGEAALEAAQADLLEAVKSLSVAQRQLAKLHRQAGGQAQTQP